MSQYLIKLICCLFLGLVIGCSNGSSGESPGNIVVVTSNEAGNEAGNVVTIDGEVTELKSNTSGTLDYVAVLRDGSTVKGMLDSNLNVLSREDDSALRRFSGLRGASRFYRRTNRNSAYDDQNCELKVYELPSGRNIWNLPPVDNPESGVVTYCSMDAIDNNDNYYYSRGRELLSIDRDSNQRWSSVQAFAPGSALVITTGEVLVHAGKNSFGPTSPYRLDAYRLADGVETLSGWVFPGRPQSDSGTPHQTLFSDNGANIYIGGLGVVNSSCLDLIESGEFSDCVITVSNTDLQYSGVQISRLQIPTAAALEESFSGYSLDAVKRFSDAEDPGVADAFYSGGYVLMQKGNKVTVLDGMTLSIVSIIDVEGNVGAAASGNIYTTVIEGGITSINTFPL